MSTDVERLFEHKNDKVIRSEVRKKLLTLKETATSHLQEITLRNYPTFITLSKDILSTLNSFFIITIFQQLNQLYQKMASN
jgi:hypothetical protein